MGSISVRFGCRRIIPVCLFRCFVLCFFSGSVLEWFLWRFTEAVVILVAFLERRHDPDSHSNGTEPHNDVGNLGTILTEILLMRGYVSQEMGEEVLRESPGGDT